MESTGRERCVQPRQPLIQNGHQNGHNQASILVRVGSALFQFDSSDRSTPEIGSRVATAEWWLACGEDHSGPNRRSKSGNRTMAAGPFVELETAPEDWKVAEVRSTNWMICSETVRFHLHLVAGDRPIRAATVGRQAAVNES